LVEAQRRLDIALDRLPPLIATFIRLEAQLEAELQLDNEFTQHYRQGGTISTNQAFHNVTTTASDSSTSMKRIESSAH
jgi:hypothetical protein